MAPINISRRAFLGAAAAAALWPSRARAGSAARAKHVLILYANGGLRSAPLFAADAAKQHNPYGRSPRSGRAEWHTGSLIDSVAPIAGDIAVLAGVDVDPGRAITDHYEADLRLATISTREGEAGFLGVVKHAHPGYVSGDLILPPVDLGRSSFARATGIFRADRPLSLGSAADFKDRSKHAAPIVRPAWIDRVRGLRDARYVASRPEADRAELEALRDLRSTSRAYAALLRNPALDLLGAPSAEQGGATNAQLLERLGANPRNEASWGLDVALALRFFQLGVPAVAVQRKIFDTHRDEAADFTAAAAELGAQLTGLHELLQRLRDADGTPLWDNTVVVIVSEMNRDHTSPETGFNSAGGSDHQGTAASRNQFWPLMGGPLRARGKKIGDVDPVTLATIGAPAISSSSVFATLLAMLGIDPSPYYMDAPLEAV